MSVLFGVVVFAVLTLLLGCGYLVVLMARYPEPVFADEVHTVTTEDGWGIVLHRRRPSSGAGEPVFLCHSLPSNHLNFELPHGASLVDTLVEAGYDCWLVDLRGCASASPAPGCARSQVTVDDYLYRDVPAAIRYVRETTGHDRVHWVGHSMGGMLLYAYVLAFGGKDLASGTTFAAPIGFDGVVYRSTPGVMGLSQYAWWLLSAVTKGLAPLYRRCRPQMAAMPINWDNVHPDIDTGSFLHLLDAPPPLVMREMDFWATNKVWRMNADQLDVKAALPGIDIPLFALYGAADPFIPLDQAEAFFDSIASQDKQMAVLGKSTGFAADFGHVDMLLSPKGAQDVYPHVVEWLKDHAIAGGVKKPPAKKKATTRKTAAKKTPAKKKAAARKTAAKKPPAKKKATTRKKATAKRRPGTTG